jgi:hypothetical protein
MVVNDLGVKRVAVFESKTNSPLVIDPNTKLAFSVPFECLKTISREHA